MNTKLLSKIVGDYIQISFGGMIPFEKFWEEHKDLYHYTRDCNHAVDISGNRQPLNLKWSCVPDVGEDKRVIASLTLHGVTHTYQRIINIREQMLVTGHRGKPTPYHLTFILRSMDYQLDKYIERGGKTV